MKPSLRPFNLIPFLIFLFVFSACGQRPAPKQGADSTSVTTGEPISPARPTPPGMPGAPGKKNMLSGQGSFSFMAGGKTYQSDPTRTKCWTVQSVPLVMLMAKGDGLLASWQFAYVDGKSSVKLDGRGDGGATFKIGDKNYSTLSASKGDHLDLEITDRKNKATVIMLSGTFSGRLSAQDGSSIEVTNGVFTTNDI